jgi:hypothetical protein
MDPDNRRMLFCDNSYFLKRSIRSEYRLKTYRSATNVSADSSRHLIDLRELHYIDHMLLRFLLSRLSPVSKFQLSLIFDHSNGSILSFV